MSLVTVMMWQPISWAWKMLRSSRGLAPDQLGVRRGVRSSSAAFMSGTGSRPVSAMRPANTEMIAGVAPARASVDRLDLLEGHDRGHVELDAGVRKPAIRAAGDAPAGVR